MCNEHHRGERRNPEPSLWPWLVTLSVHRWRYAIIWAVSVAVGTLLGRVFS